jgi:hypothetical protein
VVRLPFDSARSINPGIDVVCQQPTFINPRQTP